jgi:hypothetical protein
VAGEITIRQPQVALTVLSWLQTVEETSGQIRLALLKLWPVFALCLPSLLGFVLLLLSWYIVGNNYFGLSEGLWLFCHFWFFIVAPVSTLIAFILFVRRSWTGHVALLPALLACTMLFASVVTNLIALIAVLFSGSTYHPN